MQYLFALVNFFMDLVIYFMLVNAGPFKVNGVPLRRVNQPYVVATSTKVDISGVNVEKFDDKYFSREVQKKKKKGEGEFFEADKEVGLLILMVFVVNGKILFFMFVLILYYLLS